MKKSARLPQPKADDDLRFPPRRAGTRSGLIIEIRRFVPKCMKMYVYRMAFCRWAMSCLWTFPSHVGLARCWAVIVHRKSMLVCASSGGLKLATPAAETLCDRYAPWNMDSPWRKITQGTAHFRGGRPAPGIISHLGRHGEHSLAEYVSWLKDGGIPQRTTFISYGSTKFVVKPMMTR